MLIGLVITKTIQFFKDLANASKIAKENAEQFTSSLKELQNTQNSNTSTIIKLSEEYSTLSSKVDGLGKNIGLTSNEYDRYHEITNQVASIMPNLIQGYDEQGNAILNLKGKLVDLNTEYDKYKQNEAIKQYNEKDEKGNKKVEDVFRNYQNSQKFKGLGSYFSHFFDSQNEILVSELSDTDLLKYLNKLYQLSPKALISAGKYKGTDNESLIIRAILDTYGLNPKSTEDEIETIRQNIYTEIMSLTTDINAKVSEIGQTAITYAQQSDSYWKDLEDDQRIYISSLFNNITSDFVDENELFKKDGLELFVNNLISTLNNNKNRINDAFQELFSLNIEETDLTPIEIQDKINGLVNNIAKALNVDKDLLSESLGLDFESLDILVDDYTKAIDYATNKFKDAQKQDIQDFFTNNSINTQEEIDKWLEIAESVETAAEAVELYKNGIKNSFSDRFKKLWDSDSFSDAKEDLTKLAKESRITGKDIQSLAKENSELAVLLDESGMSAQFAAICFNKMCYGADGFSAITEDALALDKVLHGMDESLQKVTASKSAYDKAMEQDDYNSDFENYQEAYKSGMEMFENGEYGKKFRSTMEFLFGEDSYTMSIEELYSAMNSLKSVFGEDATNGLEFLDKLYAKKDILDDIGSSLVRLSDGSYDFDLKPEEFEKIGDSLGMTAEEVAACTNALGMFGDYHPYDLEELEETLNGLSMSAKDGEKSIMSLQGLEDVLSDLGYTGYDIHNIVEDIKEMGSIELLDFGNTDTDAIQSVIDKLAKLNMIEINGDNIDVSGLISALSETFGMASEDIEVFLEGLNKKFNFVDSEGGNIIDKYRQIQKEINDTESKIQTPTGTENISELQKKLEELQQQKEALRDPVEIQIDTRIERASAQLDEVSKKYDELKKKIQEKQAQGTATQADRHKLNELGSIKNSLETDIAEYNELKVTINIDREQADEDIEDITSDKETNITANITNAQEVDNKFSEWTEPKTTTLTVDVVASDPNGLLNQTGQTVNAGNANSQSGTNKTGAKNAHADGTVGNAFASGYNGLPKDEKNALRSEYGQEELTVYPNGTYEITDSPTMADLPKGTVIFNEEQTKRIIGNSFSKGTVGNAYAGGKAGGINPATKKPYRSYENTAIKQTQQAVEQAAEETAEEIEEASEEIFDWIERRIQKFQRLFDKWVKQAETALTSGFITKYYKKATAAIKKELSTYSKAYNRYMKEANAVGLDSGYAKKVRNGAIDIETIQDEELADKIQKYQEWYIYYAPLSGNRWRHSI